MKNINAAITSAENNAAQFPRHQLVLGNSLIKFNTKSSGLSNASLATNFPPSIETLSAASNSAWAVYATTGFSSVIEYVRTDISTDWDLAGTATTVNSMLECQRPGLIRIGASVYTYYIDADYGANTIQVKRCNVTSQTSNPVSLASATNFGPAIPFDVSYDDSSQNTDTHYINHVKAVMPVSSGAIVMTANRNRGSGKININFYYVTQSSYRKLETGFTGDSTGSISANYDSPEFSYACATEENGIIYVFFNTNKSGRAAYFTIDNGVESDIRLVVPIDKEDDDHNLFCYSVTKINSLFLMTGRLSFKNSDDTLSGFDCYLTSKDLKNWSVGEINSFLTVNDAKGKIVIFNDYLYYLGNLYWARAVPNKEIAPNATTAEYYDITSRSINWDLSMSADGADSFALSLNNQDLYFNSGGPEAANTIYLSSGQSATLSQIGVYSIDSASQSYATDGIQLRDVQCRDIAMKRINDWQSPIDMWLEGGFRFRSNFTSDAGMVIKSKNADDVGSFTEGASFKFTGLNTPYMMLFDGPYSESSIIKTSVYMTDSDDAHHLSSIGFMLGAHEDADGNFNSLILAVPRERGGATPYTTTAPTLRKLNLVPVDPDNPDKIDTGLNYEKYISTLWRQAADETPITTSTTATYENIGGYYRVPADTKTDLMVKLNGKKVELYAKPRARTAATWAQNAEWLLKSVTTVPDTEILYPDNKGYAGLVVSNDVSASKEWFAQGKYGDMVVQLTEAFDPVDTGTWGRVFGTGNRAGSESISYIIEGVEPEWIGYLQPGMKVMIHGVSYFTGYYIVTIEEVYESGFKIDMILPPAYEQYTSGATFVPAPGNEESSPEDYEYNIPSNAGSTSGTWEPTYAYQTIYNYEIEVRGLTQSDYYGILYSQSRATSINNSTSYINVETGAQKKALMIEGRGAVVTSDSTAMSIRHFESDGIAHWLKSGNTELGGSYTGFDETSPTLNTNRWKFILYHGKFFDGDPNNVGCKPNGHVIVNDEIIRYVTYSSLKRGRYPGDTLSYSTVSLCPAAYAPIKDANKGATAIYNWKSYGGSLPGDQFDELQTTFGISPAGMLVEVLSKNVNADKEDEGDGGYYIDSIVASTPSQTAGINLSSPLKVNLIGPIVNIDNPSDPYWSVEANRNQAPEGDMVVVSGRAQFNTKKEKHSEDSAVRYYPCDATGEAPYIQINSAEYYQGENVTTEEMVRRIAAMAGIREFKNRSAFDDASASSPLTYTLTSTPVSLPLQENMADFTLVGDFYIPGNNIVSSAVSGRNELRIYFRSNYYIAIEQYVTSSDFAAGYKGTLYIRLVTTSGLINAYNSERTLEAIKIRNIQSFSGSYSGTSTNATLTPDLSSLTMIKLFVHKKFISLEINGKRAMDFCTEEYYTDSGSSLDFYTAGPIQLSYASNIAGNSNSVLVQGLGDPVAGYALRKDSSAKGAIDEIVDERHAFVRTTEVGGIEFGSFWNRDYFGNLHTFIVSDSEDYSNEQIVGHIGYKSDKINANWIDEDWILENGYKYISSSGSNVENTYYALREAKLVVRRQKEEAFTREIEALPRLALQPEDEVDISHPNLPEGRYVINSINIIAEDSASMKASYSVRKKVV